MKFEVELVPLNCAVTTVMAAVAGQNPLETHFFSCFPFTITQTVHLTMNFKRTS